MTITTAKSVSGSQWSSGATAGKLTVSRSLGPASKTSPTGFSGFLSSINPSAPALGTVSGVSYITAGIDPVIIYQILAAIAAGALTSPITLRTSGQIWPVGFN
jgi:hypothetical protein